MTIVSEMTTAELLEEIGQFVRNEYDDSCGHEVCPGFRTWAGRRDALSCCSS